MNHKQEIAKLLMQYLSAFPASKIEESGILVYANALEPLTIAEINAALLKLLRTCKFFPSVAEIIEAAGNVRQFAEGKELPSPDEAWNEALRETHDKFVYGKWELSCPEVEQAVQHFGKMELCLLTPEGMNAARAQFMRIYSAICNRAKEKAVNEAVMKSLPQRHVQMLVGGLAEKKALGAAT